MLGASLRLGVRVVSLAPGLLRYQLAPGLAPLADADIRKGLDNATGLSWQVERVTDGEAAPSLEEARLAAESQARESLRRSPLVEAAFAAFPGAELIEEEAASPSRGGPGERNWSRRA
jgi:DNA polymerase-3 subunit gamma/tau